MLHKKDRPSQPVFSHLLLISYFPSGAVNLAQDVLMDGEADDQEDDGRDHDAGIIVLEIRAFSMFHEDAKKRPECRHHEDDVVNPVVDRRYGRHDQDHEADGQPDPCIA